MLEDAQATLSSADLFADKKVTSRPMWSSEHLASPTGDVENNTTGTWTSMQNQEKLYMRTFLQDNHSAVICANNNVLLILSSLFAEKHTKRQNVCACFLTAWKAVRHLFQVNHHIPNPNPIDGSFDFLYEVGEKLGSGHHGILFEGIRKSDGKHVAIKFAKKRQPDYPIELAGYSKPLSREAAIMLMLQKPPNGDHVIQLYDWFVMAKQNILIMEYPRTSMTLLKFIQRNRMRLTEATAKSIMQQLIVAL
ncbi:hypothetical protein Q8A67_022946 [Cirrhinus molitorella]|uniref:non-specific serine/threonine protein kinase n=1 Tax=Cirrhinus molitorella TaxID=172907 RepID=A0AA88TFR0_9TELE|nr:hypothetical protein Q8A67_022946 [Cirrhinus molitorella]